MRPLFAELEEKTKWWRYTLFDVTNNYRQAAGIALLLSLVILWGLGISAVWYLLALCVVVVVVRKVLKWNRERKYQKKVVAGNRLQAFFKHTVVYDRPADS